MSHCWTRRDLLRIAVAAPIGSYFGTFHSYAQSHRGKVKITSIKAMQIQNIAGNCLIQIGRAHV